MATSTISQTPAPRPRHMATLIGFYSEMEAAKVLLVHNFVDLPATLAELHELWKRCSEKCALLQPRSTIAPSFQSTLELDQYELKIKAWPIYQRNASLVKADFHLLNVPVNELIEAWS